MKSRPLNVNTDTAMIRKRMAEAGIYVVEYGTDWNYSIGTAINDAAAIPTVILPAQTTLGIALGWNYADSVYSITQGIRQILDEEDYRQTQNKIKGIVNIISGIEMFVFSYNPALTAALGLAGGAALASPAFALAMLCDLITATIDFYNAQKEVEFQGWLEERIKEINYLEKRIETLREKIMRPSSNEKTDFLNDSTLQTIDYLAKEKLRLIDKRNQLIAVMQSRCRVYCHDTTVSTDEQTARATWVKQTLDGLTEKSISIDYQSKPTDIDTRINNHVQSQLTKQYQESRNNLAMKALSFVGMTLLAVGTFVACPPLLIVGLVVTSIVAAYYLYKNKERIAAKIKEIRQHGLFKPHTDNITAQCSALALSLAAH
ncbi:MAG: hypothetical protein A3E83_04105 [Gammaproteobacteria bacterium RIFCSPHIGHO2_12_FULL_41_20]|nr:MAG: hypothetical protein A3E83_04105 [Gammaproteobacteria bacterium RIFCSPHIGHO2_12_FULL_41_20]